MKNILILLAVIVLILVVIYALRPRIFKNFSSKFLNKGSSYTQQNNGSIDNSSNPIKTNTKTTTNSNSEIPVSPSNGLTLTVNSPTDNQQLSSLTVTVSGKTSPNADISVNDKDVKAGSNGNFSTSITLEDGDDTIYVVANDSKGNFAEKDIPVLTP